MTACSSTSNKQVVAGSVQAADKHSAAQWRCEAGSDKQWQCHDLSKAGSSTEMAKQAQPIKSVPAESVAIPTVTEKVVADTTKPSPENSTPYADDTYVVQLIAARDPETITRFKQQQPQLVATPLSIEKDGETWLVLILGTYATYADAQTAIAEVKPPLTTQPWIRPLAPIRQYLDAQP